MSHFFGVGGNPFGSPIGQLIEKGTDGTTASENWALYLEICDLINETEDGPKDALKAIKKRLSHNAGRNYQVVMYTLTLLETCVKNCGRRFHLQVVHKDFLQDLIKIIGPKNDPPQIVQEKILSLIQTWADAFQGIPELKEVGKVYQELKTKGIIFPPTDLDHMVPIHTPARTTPGMDPPAPVPQRAPSHHQQVRSPPHRAHTVPYPQQAVPVVQIAGQPVPQPQARPAPVPPGPVMLTPEQMGKLKTELDTVQQNVKVFSEMMTELTPGQENPADLELLQDLNRTCRQMQHRMVDLVERIQNEEVTGELLQMNDDLNNVFLRYERFERLRATQMGINTDTAAPPPSFDAAVSQQMAQPQPPPPALQPPPWRHTDPHAPPPPYTAAGDSAPVGNLIDLGDGESHGGVAKPTDISLQLAGMNLGTSTVSGTLNQLNTTTATNAGPDDEFDMFAQSRQSFEENKQVSASGAYMNQHTTDQFAGGLGAAVAAKSGGNLIDRETDYEEMEKYLQQTQPSGEAVRSQGQDTATSSEFDRFLADRAKDTDDLPDSGNPQQRQQNRGGRQMQKDDPENALFAL